MTECIEIQRDQTFDVSHEGYSHLVTADVEVTEKFGKDVSRDPQVFNWKWFMCGVARVFGREVKLYWGGDCWWELPEGWKVSGIEQSIISQRCKKVV